MRVKKEIIYPFFLECCQFTEDTFWESLFENLAYGISPYGTYIHKGFLSCSYKNKEFSYKIERKDPKTLYDDIYNLCTNKVGILSRKEKLKKKLDFHEIEKRIKNSRQKWSDIKKKNIKDLLIERYVLDMRLKYNLNMKQTKYLLSTITFANVFKLITSKDVVYENGVIRRIEGINIDEGGDITLRKEIGNGCISGRMGKEKVRKKMLENWEKFLIQMRKSEKK